MEEKNGRRLIRDLVTTNRGFVVQLDGLSVHYFPIFSVLLSSLAGHLDSVFQFLGICCPVRWPIRTTLPIPGIYLPG